MKLAKNLENLGTETAFSVLAEAKALEAKGNPMIHLGLGQPDFKTPKHVVEAAKKALDDGHHGYVMSNGIPECRQAVTRWIKKRYSVDVDFERILIMPGGKPTMSYAIQCFGEPGAEIIHPTPAFPIYESMINYTGSTSVPYDLTEDKDLKFNPEKILSLITDKTRLLILINPNNPTGSFVEKSDIDVLKATKQLLESWGCNVKTARNKDEVMNLIKEDPYKNPDIILADNRLPGDASGIDITYLIQEK